MKCLSKDAFLKNPFLKVENISAFNHLIRILATQVGALLNKSELADTLKIRFETVSRYLDILECKFRNRIRIPKIFSNFEKRYPERPKIRVVITKDRLGRKEGTYFIPAYTFPLVKLESLS